MNLFQDTIKCEHRKKIEEKTKKTSEIEIEDYPPYIAEPLQKFQILIFLQKYSPQNFGVMDSF